MRNYWTLTDRIFKRIWNYWIYWNKVMFTKETKHLKQDGCSMPGWWWGNFEGLCNVTFSYSEWNSPNLCSDTQFLHTLNLWLYYIKTSLIYLYHTQETFPPDHFCICWRSFHWLFEVSYWCPIWSILHQESPQEASGRVRSSTLNVNQHIWA